MKPVPSATPTPIMMVKTVPSAKNPVKLGTTAVTIYRMLSGAKRLTASTVFLVISPLVRSRKSYVTDNPRNPHRADTRMTIPVRIRKITAGSGSLFPTRSTVSKAFWTMLFFCPSFAKTIPPIMCILCPAKFFCGRILYPVYHSLLYRLILHSDIIYGASAKKTTAEFFVILTVTFRRYTIFIGS